MTLETKRKNFIRIFRVGYVKYFSLNSITRIDSINTVIKAKIPDSIKTIKTLFPSTKKIEIKQRGKINQLNKNFSIFNPFLRILYIMFKVGYVKNFSLNLSKRINAVSPSMKTNTPDNKKFLNVSISVVIAKRNITSGIKTKFRKILNSSFIMAYPFILILASIHIIPQKANYANKLY